MTHDRYDPLDLGERAALLHTIAELEITIKESKERSSLILAALPIGVLLTFPDGTIDAANRLIESMFGYERGTLARKSLDYLLPNLKTAQPTKLGSETLARRHDSTYFPVQLSMLEVPTPEGERVFVFVTDITERRRMEQLRKEFTAMITHDLRTPLMNVSGIIELASAGKFGELPELCKEQLNEADKNLTRLIQMISELLEIERLEDASIVLDARLNNLTSTAGEAIGAVERLASDKNVVIKVWDENVFLVFDNDRIHRVLVNLLSNAIKFAPSHTTITLEHEYADQSLEIRVIDEGPGICEDARETIFNKYAQLSSKDATKRGGTGLGLAICKGVVEAHGGSIGVRDNPKTGSGSVFWFRLPLTDD